MQLSHGPSRALKDLANQLLFRSRYPFAIVAGLVLAAAFLEIGLTGLAWVAPALILACAWNKTGADAFRIGYVAGLTHYLASLYWLLLIPVRFYPILGWVALSAYLALYPAIWVWLMSGLRGQGADSTWLRRTAWSLGGAALWVALEMIVGRLLSGFPWNYLGTSQYRMLPLIQIASVTGVYGVTFVIVWFSLSLYSGVTAILRQPTRRHAWLGEMILPMATLAGFFAFGLGRLREPSPEGPTLGVTFIQPSIPQTMIWNTSENSNRFQKLLELTERGLTATRHGVGHTNEPLTRPADTLSPSDGERDEVRGSTTDLLLWPEAALPEFNETSFAAITNLIRSHGVWMIFGADDVEAKANPTKDNPYDVYNAAFLFNPDGHYVATYRKRHLVMFGEYIPLESWLPFAKWFTYFGGSFSSGDKVVPFELTWWGERPREPQSTSNDGSSGASPHQKTKTATLICFEDVFPHLVREYVNDDTDFLVNLTNDGWFGEGAEQWQHAAAAVFRAVENGLPLARCCNNGLTCWIDSCGRIRDILRDKNGTIYGTGVMTAQIPVLAPDEKRTRTFYNKHGDWFGWVCVGLAVLVVLARLKFPNRNSAAV